MAAEGSHRFHPPFRHSEFTFINVVPSSGGQVASTSLIRIVQHVKPGTSWHAGMSQPPPPSGWTTAEQLVLVEAVARLGTGATPDFTGIGKLVKGAMT